MATNTQVRVVLDETTTVAPRLTALQILHDWVTTVDHKKIGLMYIGYALLFLVIGGVEAVLMRIQLMIPNNTFVSPQVFNRLFTMHGTTMVFFRRHADSVWLRKLSGPADDWCEGHGVSTPECIQFLGGCVWRLSPLLQLSSAAAAYMAREPRPM